MLWVGASSNLHTGCMPNKGIWNVGGDPYMDNVGTSMQQVGERAKYTILSILI